MSPALLAGLAQAGLAVAPMFLKGGAAGAAGTGMSGVAAELGASMLKGLLQNNSDNNADNPFSPSQSFARNQSMQRPKYLQEPAAPHTVKPMKGFL